MKGVARAVRVISQSALRRRCSTAAASSKEDVEVDRFLPSRSFLKTHVRSALHREKLSNRISELQLFHELHSGQKLPKLDDSSWLTFFKLNSPEERARYLIELTKFEAPVEENTEKRLISEVNQERSDRGEMVYAPSFNEFWELKGREFRGKVDGLFGSRLLAQERTGEDLPKLVVDCRFMREYSVGVQTSFAKQINSLQEANWTSRLPFNVGIANFKPDSQLADIAKKSWLFRYGPPSATESFSPHPFAPAISPRAVKEVAQCDPESIMYISWRATRFLPDVPPPDTKAVVLCASHDMQPWSSSVSAAQKDNIKAYRIPIQRHVVLDKDKVTLSLGQSAAVLREYFSGNDIGSVLNSIFERRKNFKNTSAREERELIEKYKTACEGLEREKKRQVDYQKWLTKPSEKKPRVHRYSREERRQRLAAQ